MGNEKWLIDANALLKEIDFEYDLGYGEILTDPRRFAEMVEDAPTVDAVEVVRCKDCKNYKNNGHNFYCDCDSVNECTDSCFFEPPDEDFYCRYGERKDIVWKIADPNWERITNFNGIPLDGEERKDNG